MKFDKHFGKKKPHYIEKWMWYLDTRTLFICFKIIIKYHGLPSPDKSQTIYCRDQKQKINVQIKISRFSFLDNLDKCLVRKNLVLQTSKYKMLNVFPLPAGFEEMKNISN